MKKCTKSVLLLSLLLASGSGILSAKTLVDDAPATAAPTPTVAAAKVISVFSNAYTNVSGSNFNPNWGQATQVSTIQVVGNDVLKYANLNYQGTDFGSDINATGMDHLHVDVWTADETTLNIYPISRATGEKFQALTPLLLNQWNSFDIPLTAFTAQGLSMADLFQFKFTGVGGKTVYLDNIYFYNSSANVDTQAPTAFTATAAAAGSTSIVFTLNATDDSGTVNFEISYGDKKVSTIGTSAETKTYKLSGLTPATAYTFSVVAKDAAGNQASNNPIALNASTLAQVTTVPTIDFETVGSDWAWTIFENGGNDAALYAVLDNPVTTGINASAKCGRYNVNTNGQPWAGLWSASIGEFTLTASNCLVHVMVHKTVISPMTLKFENDDASVNGEVQHSNTKTGEWELMTFDFTPHIGKTVTKIVLFPDFPAARNGVGSTNLFDNISFNSNVVDGLAQSSKEGVSLYPNPVTGPLTIRSAETMTQISVSNLLGQNLLQAVVGSTETELDLRELPAGNYLVTILDHQGKRTTRKIVKL